MVRALQLGREGRADAGDASVTDLIPRSTLTEVVAHRDRALELYADAFEAIRRAHDAVLAAEREVGLACAGVGEGYRSYVDAHQPEIQAFDSAVQLPDAELYRAAAERLTDLRVWASLIERTDLEALMDRQAKEELRKQMSATSRGQDRSSRDLSLVGWGHRSRPIHRLAHRCPGGDVSPRRLVPQAEDLHHDRDDQQKSEEPHRTTYDDEKNPLHDLPGASVHCLWVHSLVSRKAVHSVTQGIPLTRESPRSTSYPLSPEGEALVCCHRAEQGRAA